MSRFNASGVLSAGLGAVSHRVRPRRSRGEGKTKSDTLGTRMYRHMWAADRLWEGLTGSSDEAWRAGAEALARAPEQPPRAKPPLSQQFANALFKYESGQRALEADSLADRANVYGLFLASCAGCHALHVELTFSADVRVMRSRLRCRP